MEKLCPHSQFLKEFGVYGQGNSQTEKMISYWIEDLKLSR